MSKTSSAGAKKKTDSRMGSGASQKDPLTSKRGPSSVYNSTLSSAGTSSINHSSTAQHGSGSGAASRGVVSTAYPVGVGTSVNRVQVSRGVAQPASHQTGTRTSANGVRGYEPPKESPRSDVFPNSLKKKDNLKFYSNEISSKPFPGTKIDDILRKWKGDYHKLEYDHQYIQWLFPLPEGKGLNMWAQPLQEHEAISIQSDKGLQLRVLRAFMMMLDFYGIKLVSSDTGEVTRADNYIERFDHLNRSMHNYRRITRIIKSIGCLGYGKLQAPLVKFLINEACVQKTLWKIKGGSIHHWIDAIADDKEKEETMKFFLDVNHGENYLDDYYSVESADEAMEDMEDNPDNVDPRRFEDACSLEDMHKNTGRSAKNVQTGDASNLEATYRDSGRSDIHSDMLRPVGQTPTWNTHRDTRSSYRSSDLSHSVGKTSNSGVKLKGFASEGNPLNDPTVPSVWD